jgi:hypothetical protein
LKKTRQNKKIERGRDSIQSERALNRKIWRQDLQPVFELIIGVLPMGLESALVDPHADAYPH